ncbi:hypothetical protein GCM10007424_22090 [Flavobacterium suaedae]|uniref:Uncharacterized protein n=1 Tax=Flavobacterium suaedae TaxID=1767027 RepID=A0ABQ1JZK2_9FLAO|nr:hypothetical protein GCM10007424_22090 [Flavobacterium suaedae]
MIEKPKLRVAHKFIDLLLKTKIVFMVSVTIAIVRIARVYK